MIQSKLHSPYSVHINPIFLLFFEYLFATYKNQQRQQASSLAAVVDCDRKYVPNNVYDSYLRVMMELMSPVSNPAPGVRPGIKLVEPRGVEPLSESASTRTSPGAVCRLRFPPRHAGKQAYRFGRVILHDEGNSYLVHVHH